MIAIELTDMCNHICRWCTLNRRSNILRLDIIKKVAYTLNRREIVFTGGEPLIHPRFTDILNIFDGFNIGLETNGELLSGKFMQIADKCSWVKIPIEYLFVSDIARVRGCTSERIVRTFTNIKFLRDTIRNRRSPCKIILSIKYHKFNIDELIDIIDSWFFLGKIAVAEISPVRHPRFHCDLPENVRDKLIEKNYYNGFIIKENPGGDIPILRVPATCKGYEEIQCLLPRSIISQKTTKEPSGSIRA